MCDKININISDYSIGDLYSLVSLSAEIATPALIQQKVDRLKLQFKDDEFHLFMNNVADKLIHSLNRQRCGYENNVINFLDKNILKHDIDLINPNNNKYYERNIIEKILIIDTKYRDHYKTELATDFNIVLPTVIKNVISIQLSDIEFPNTWYPFDETKGNTFFHVKESSESVWKRVDISSQAYFYQDLFISINNSMSNLNVLMDFVFNLDFANSAGAPSGTATVSINQYIPPSNGDLSGVDLSGEPQTSKKENYDFDFFSDNPNVLIYKGDDVGRCSRFLGWSLGFRNIDPLFYTGATTYTSESTIDLGGPRYIYLIVNDHNKYMNESFIPFSKYMATIKDTLNIFARISLQGSAFSLYNSNSFSVFSDIRKYNGLVDISRMSIKLVDEYGTPLNLNNNDYSFTIRIHTVQST